MRLAHTLELVEFVTLNGLSESHCPSNSPPTTTTRRLIYSQPGETPAPLTSTTSVVQLVLYSGKSKVGSASAYVTYIALA